MFNFEFFFINKQNGLLIANLVDLFLLDLKISSCSLLDHISTPTYLGKSRWHDLDSQYNILLNREVILFKRMIIFIRNSNVKDYLYQKFKKGWLSLSEIQIERINLDRIWKLHSTNSINTLPRLTIERALSHLNTTERL